MKKLFLTILILLSSVSLSFGAIASTTVWEVRTTGDATNGGGFNASQTSAGTDYSQQDTAQLALTDLASTSASSWLTLTSATGGFTAEMIGNIIYIASGTNFTAGYYEITAYTDTNTVTVDRACGATGDATSGAGKVGGATDNVQAVETAHEAGNICYVKSGTYTSAGTSVLSFINKSITYIGYKNTRGDWPIGDDRPALDGEATRKVVVTNNYADHQFQHFIFKNSSHKGVENDYASVSYFNCRATNNAGNGINVMTSTDSYLFVELDNNGSNGGYSNRSDSNRQGINFIYAHDNAADGIYNDCSSFPPTQFSIFESNSSDGLVFSRGTVYASLIGNIFYNNTGYGFNSAGGSSLTAALIANNAFVSNGTGVRVANPTMVMADYNSYYGNTTDRNGVPAGAHDVTSDPSFTNAAGADFTLQSGSPLIGAGLDLSTFTSLTTDFNVNIGVDQGDHSATSYGFSN